MKASWKRIEEIFTFTCPHCDEVQTFLLKSNEEKVLDITVLCISCKRQSKVLPYGDLEKLK